tara:strand:- start:1677 stop:2081 length:405 start_codon:yes stop_codon:yes gene_type:complete
MEITLTIENEQYSNEEIKKVIGKYKKAHEDMKTYSKNRYEKMKENLKSEDPELKSKAEDHRRKLRENSLNYYKRTDSTCNPELHKARCKYTYYKKKNTLETFIKNDKFIETIELLKDDTTSRRTAEEKYPELFK